MGLYDMLLDGFEQDSRIYREIESFVLPLNATLL